MLISVLADFAEVIAAIGVIASLIFVGVEVKRNTNQSKLQNWASLMDRFIAVYSETGNLDFAAVIAKGRLDYDALTDAEKIAYGNHLYEICVALEAFVNFSRNDDEVHGRIEMESQFEKNIQYHIACPGGLAWYREYQATRPFPPQLSERIESALEKSSK
jgi:hypothetical protein